MFKSCKYCGKIHDFKYECPSKPKKINRYSEINGKIKKFRNSMSWQNKRGEIQQRDLHMCQVCIRKLYDWLLQYNYEDTSVHHINKLIDMWDKRLDNNNLITLCNMHHTMADQGQIPIEVLLQIAKEQEEKSN